MVVKYVREYVRCQTPKAGTIAQTRFDDAKNIDQTTDAPGNDAQKVDSSLVRSTTVEDISEISPVAGSRYPEEIVPNSATSADQ